MGTLGHMIRICPACQHRHAQLVDPDCPVCDGSGVIRLGSGALSIYDPATVATAAAIALEASARAADQSLTLTDDRVRPVRESVNMLIAAGVLAGPPRAPRPPRVRPRRRNTNGRYAPETTPTALARQCVQATILDIDAILIAAPHFLYEETDRPNARGLPLLAASGHPSHLARITDPETPGADTYLTVRKRHREEIDARVLVAAAPLAATARRARKGRAA